jgi:hypothetical protein
MRVSKSAVNYCNLDRGLLGLVEKVNNTKAVISVNGWHELAIKFIATDVTLIH